LKKVLQKFNINDDIKSVSTSLAPHFKLKDTITPITVKEHKYITYVPYTRIVSSLMYANDVHKGRLVTSYLNGQ